MSHIAILGAGAFGTGLAIALAQGGTKISLIARDHKDAANIQETRVNARRLPNIPLPEKVTVSANTNAMQEADAILMAVPTQALSKVLDTVKNDLGAAPLVACCKGVDLSTLQSPLSVLETNRPTGAHALLTGPSFAADIAQGLPTALTLACHDERAGEHLQNLLSTPVLRLYRTTDTIGAGLGGALKNVIAIAAGIAIGAGLGESARAALMTRGYAEMTRLALELGARAETLAGLSGFGDLVLTSTSEQSRNFRYGLTLGRSEPFPKDITVEGAATARAVSKLAYQRGVDMPITATIAALIEGSVTINGATEALLARPLKEE